MNCKKCKGTKLIPFKKDGSVVPNAWIHCSCYEEEPEHYHPVLPEDFDFPMSYDFRAYVNGEPSIEPPKIVTTEIEPQWSKKQWDYVKQLKARVLHGERKIVELSLKKKRKSKYD